jgi:protein-L-isoaspartate(D-aspartate) O-methyltransferase
MDYASLRESMVTEQIIARGIRDAGVIEAFRSVPRHDFMPAKYAGSAYEDHPVPIGEGQTISQPYMVALMTKCLALKSGEKVLEIGTGSGYQTAILAEIAKEVNSVERIGALAEAASAVLRKLGYDNVRIKTDDGTIGWKEHAPYDGIIVTAGAPQIPKSLLAQLSDGGRLVIPVGGEFGQVLTLVERKGDAIEKRELCGCVFVPLIGKEGWREA